MSSPNLKAMDVSKGNIGTRLELFMNYVVYQAGKALLLKENHHTVRSKEYLIISVNNIVENYGDDACINRHVYFVHKRKPV